MSEFKKNYYKNQALKGGKLNIRKYYPSRRQRGYGFLSTIARRFAIPIIKLLGTEALKGGTDILTDILPGVNIAKQNLKRKAATTLRSLSDKIEQSGVGRKRRKRTSRKTTIKGSGRKKKTKKSKSKKKTRKSKKSRSKKVKDIFKTF